MIRLARAEDRAALYDICVRTGWSGADATGRYDDEELLGHVYVGPYLALAPELALVATLDDDPDGRPQGYCLGAADSAAFAERCERLWWPPLRARYPRDSPRRATDQSLVALIHEPDSMPAAVVARYPAHLHIDLLPTMQGVGMGRALIERMLAALSDAGSPGVHLGVSADNAHAIGFYRRLGFHEVGHGPGSVLMACELGAGPGQSERTRSR
jgi:ribosomal protein S18 acetylase RimI-like enzyme